MNGEQTMARPRRFGVLTTATLLGILMGFTGLICGILYAFGGFVFELLTGTLNAGTVLAFGALIGMPVTFAVFGFMAGALGAVLYNLVVGWIGGAETPGME